MDGKTYYCISHCLSCPECGEGEFYRCPMDIEGVDEVSCFFCGATWYERDHDEDEDES